MSVWQPLVNLAATRAKAIAGFIITGATTYIAESILKGHAVTGHGIELAIAAAVLAGLGVHQTANAKPQPKLKAKQARRHLEFLPAVSGRKLGRQPKPVDNRDLRLARYLTTALPKPPTHVDWAVDVSTYPMLLNDTLGDCTIAGALHAVQTWADNAGTVFTPTDAEALAGYEHFGYKPGDTSTDNGCVERDVLKFWKATGLGGHKVLAYVAVDPTNHDQVKQAIALFGCLYVGLALPTTAQNQGVHWTKKTGPDAAPGSWGGHCVIYTGYDRHSLKTVTWGQEGTATWGFHDTYCEEAWAVISPDWMNAAGVSPTGLDLAALQTDLQAI